MKSIFPGSDDDDFTPEMAQAAVDRYFDIGPERERQLQAVIKQGRDGDYHVPYASVGYGSDFSDHANYQVFTEKYPWLTYCKLNPDAHEYAVRYGDEGATTWHEFLTGIPPEQWDEFLEDLKEVQNDPDGFAGDLVWELESKEVDRYWAEDAHWDVLNDICAKLTNSFHQFVVRQMTVEDTWEIARKLEIYPESQGEASVWVKTEDIAEQFDFDDWALTHDIQQHADAWHNEKRRAWSKDHRAIFEKALTHAVAGDEQAQTLLHGASDTDLFRLLLRVVPDDFGSIRAPRWIFHGYHAEEKNRWFVGGEEVKSVDNPHVASEFGLALAAQQAAAQMTGTRWPSPPPEDHPEFQFEAKSGDTFDAEEDWDAQKAEDWILSGGHDSGKQIYRDEFVRVLIPYTLFTLQKYVPKAEPLLNHSAQQRTNRQEMDALQRDGEIMVVVPMNQQTPVQYGTGGPFALAVRSEGLMAAWSGVSVTNRLDSYPTLRKGLLLWFRKKARSDLEKYFPVLLQLGGFKAVQRYLPRIREEADDALKFKIGLAAAQAGVLDTAAELLKHDATLLTKEGFYAVYTDWSDMTFLFGRNNRGTAEKVFSGEMDWLRDAAWDASFDISSLTSDLTPAHFDTIRGTLLWREVPDEAGNLVPLTREGVDALSNEDIEAFLDAEELDDFDVYRDALRHAASDALESSLESAWVDGYEGAVTDLLGPSSWKKYRGKDRLAFFIKWDRAQEMMDETDSFEGSLAELLDYAGEASVRDEYDASYDDSEGYLTQLLSDQLGEIEPADYPEDPNQIQLDIDDPRGYRTQYFLYSQAHPEGANHALTSAEYQQTRRNQPWRFNKEAFDAYMVQQAAQPEGGAPPAPGLGESKFRAKKPTRPIGPFVVKAFVSNDATGKEYHFDAWPWFAQATIVDMRALEARGWCRSEAADEVARTVGQWEKPLSVFIDNCSEGFEVYVEEEDAEKAMNFRLGEEGMKLIPFSELGESVDFFWASVIDIESGDRLDFDASPYFKVAPVPVIRSLEGAGWKGNRADGVALEAAKKNKTLANFLDVASGGYVVDIDPVLARKAFNQRLGDEGMRLIPSSELNDSLKEFIEWPAVRIDGQHVFTGFVHGSAFNKAVAQGLITDEEGLGPRHEEGFVTNLGRWMEREEAFDFAKAHHQAKDPDADYFDAEDLIVPESLRAESAELDDIDPERYLDAVRFVVRLEHIEYPNSEYFPTVWLNMAGVLRSQEVFMTHPEALAAVAAYKSRNRRPYYNWHIEPAACDEHGNALQESAYGYGCAMIKLPVGHADFIIQWGQANIPDESVWNEGDEGGRETDVHTTAKYGFVGDPLAELRDIGQNTAPFPVYIGEVSLFQQPDHDVVKLDVESPWLHQLNDELSRLPSEDKYPTFKPHITVAYVKKGSCDHLVGADLFAPEGSPSAEFMATNMDYQGATEDSDDPDRVVNHILFSKPKLEEAKEQIKACAIRMKDGRVITGRMHHDCLDRAVALGLIGELPKDELPYEVYDIEPGFVTSAGRFLNREEAYQLAASTGLVPDEGELGQLHGSDVWESVDSDDIDPQRYIDALPDSMENVLRWAGFVQTMPTRWAREYHVLGKMRYAAVFYRNDIRDWGMVAYDARPGSGQVSKAFEVRGEGPVREALARLVPVQESADPDDIDLQRYIDTTKIPVYYELYLDMPQIGMRLWFNTAGSPSSKPERLIYSEALELQKHLQPSYAIPVQLKPAENQSQMYWQGVRWPEDFYLKDGMWHNKPVVKESAGADPDDIDLPRYIDTTIDTHNLVIAADSRNGQKVYWRVTGVRGGRQSWVPQAQRATRYDSHAPAAAEMNRLEKVLLTCPVETRGVDHVRLELVQESADDDPDDPQRYIDAEARVPYLVKSPVAKTYFDGIGWQHSLSRAKQYSRGEAEVERQRLLANRARLGSWAAADPNWCVVVLAQPEYDLWRDSIGEAEDSDKRFVVYKGGAPASATVSLPAAVRLLRQAVKEGAEVRLQAHQPFDCLPFPIEPGQLNRFLRGGSRRPQRVIL